MEERAGTDKIALAPLPAYLRGGLVEMLEMSKQDHKRCEHCGKVAADVSLDRWDNLLCGPCRQAVAEDDWWDGAVPDEDEDD